MKKYAFVICAFLALQCSTANAQFTASYHQSATPFVGVNYAFANGLMPEMRIFTDLYLDYFAIEAVVLYGLIRKTDYTLYAGAGLNTHVNTSGVAVPMGLNLYPFENKNFGFQMELAPIIGEEAVIRGSLGIRYRFSVANAEE
jgi:hypothetical protein